MAAYEIIKMISQQHSVETASSNLKGKKPSLISQKDVQKSFSQMIADKLNQIDIDKNIAQQFNSMFDPHKGIYLPKQFEVQRRIRDAEQNQKFVFHPNRLVTTQVFKKLRSYKDVTIFYGPPGISKTTSIILFSYLTTFINQYQFQYDDFEFAKQIPRIFYFSYESSNIQVRQINKSEINSNVQAFVIQKIIQNFPSPLKNKIQQMLKNKNMEISEICNFIKKQFQSKNILLKAVVDQFNTYVALIKEYNDYIKELIKQAGFDLNKHERQKNIYKIIISDYYYWFRVLKTLSNQALFLNNSHNFQSDTIGSNSYPFFGLNLNHHSFVQIIYIDYFKALKKIEGKIQILRMIFFQMKKKVNQKVLVEKINLMENEILKSKSFFF